MLDFIALTSRKFLDYKASVTIGAIRASLPKCVVLLAVILRSWIR
jgi:hypothetical protein